MRPGQGGLSQANGTRKIQLGGYRRAGLEGGKTLEPQTCVCQISLYCVEIPPTKGKEKLADSPFSPLPNAASVGKPRVPAPMRPNTVITPTRLLQG